MAGDEMNKKERERRRERLKIFANQNQWMKKGDMQQTLEEMSAQLRECRRDLKQLRLQEAAMEGRVDHLQRQVDGLEQEIYGRKESGQEKPVSEKIVSIYEPILAQREGFSVFYSEQGLECEETVPTWNRYA